jgi:hypothetical protein
MQIILDSVSQGKIVGECLVQVIENILGARRTAHYASSEEAKYRFSIWETKINCAILPKITRIILTTFVDRRGWGISGSLMLADEKLNRPNSIGILLGADVFFDVRHHYKKTGP